MGVSEPELQATRLISCTYCGEENQVEMGHKGFYRCLHCDYDVQTPEEHLNQEKENEKLDDFFKVHWLVGMLLVLGLEYLFYLAVW